MIFIKTNAYGGQATIDLQGESINQGSNRINELFVTFASYESRDVLRALTCTFTFKLPSGKRIDNLASTLTSYTYKETAYNGYRIVLTDAETTESGTLDCTIKLFDDAKTLATTTITLNVNSNDATGDAEPNITQEQYTQLLEEMNNKVSSEGGTSTEQELIEPTINGGSVIKTTICEVNFFGGGNLFTNFVADGTIKYTSSSDSIFDLQTADVRVTSNPEYDYSPISYKYLKTDFVSLIDNEMSQKLSDHNTSSTAHQDMRNLVSANTSGIINNQMQISMMKSVDTDLQKQIDDINASQNSVDMVGTYADLLAYNTSKLKDNDIVTIIADETHEKQTSYYKWLNDEWNFLASTQVDAFTKAETQVLLTQNTEADKQYTDSVVANERNERKLEDSKKANASDVYTKQEVNGLVTPVIINSYNGTLNLVDNQIYDLGTITSKLEIAFPSGLNATYGVELDFKTQNVSPTLIYSDDVKFTGDDVVEGVFVPDIYKEYQIIFTYNNGGIKGIVCAY